MGRFCGSDGVYGHVRRNVGCANVPLCRPAGRDGGRGRGSRMSDALLSDHPWNWHRARRREANAHDHTLDASDDLLFPVRRYSRTVFSLFVCQSDRHRGHVLESGILLRFNVKNTTHNPTTQQPNPTTSNQQPTTNNNQQTTTRPTTSSTTAPTNHNNMAVVSVFVCV